MITSRSWNRRCIYMELINRVALVTGSGRNIGKSIALKLASMGADVIVNAKENTSEANQTVESIKQLGRKSISVIGDIGSQESVNKIINQIETSFNHVDIVVNNASLRRVQPFSSMTYENWREMINTDLDSAFLLTQPFVETMIENQWGRVINIAGLNAVEGRSGWAHVSAAKMGLIGFTRSLSKELAPHGITVNCISPGMIDTSRTDLSSPRPVDRQSHIPIGRKGYLEEISGLCGWLCMEESGFISGQTIHVNGGEKNY
ncbi:MAG TPA: 3-oxoacyl-ACP reductase [Dehalococcoidia bacterium]|jgi:3-oxoacyl-[acyl-carrier protein] reductase|nr:3-oxoacyl-ACP reductase [Dehalococcoidia bacterium]